MQTLQLCDITPFQLLDIIVIGAGPHSLAFTSRLIHQSGDAYTDREHILDLWWKGKFPQLKKESNQFEIVRTFAGVSSTAAKRVAIFDASGQWMSRWNEQFEHLQIKYLRSPLFHHPDPFDPDALRCHADKYKKNTLSNPELLCTGKLFQQPSSISGTKRREKLGAVRCAQKTVFNAANKQRFDRPSTKIFKEFCDNLITNYQLVDSVHKAYAKRIEPVQVIDSETKTWFKVTFGDGSFYYSKKIVVAVGQGIKIIPQWVRDIKEGSFPADRLRHALEPIQLKKLALKGQKVMIVGGGLTSAHLAIAAIKYGCSQVIFISRKKLETKLFDVDLPWIGKYRKILFSEFWKKSPEERYETIKNARRGGSITPEVMEEFQKQIEADKILLLEEHEVCSAVWNLNQWTVNGSFGCHQADHIWLATGSKNDVNEEPLFADLMNHFPIPVLNGLPIIDTDLRWKEGVECYLMGGYAALQLGPDAFNLAAAIAGSGRICDALLSNLDSEIENDSEEEQPCDICCAKEKKKLPSSCVDGNMFNFLTEDYE